MGEYIKVPGRGTVKLGTCENLYYCTYQQAERWCHGTHIVPGNLEARHYLDPKRGWRYRILAGYKPKGD